MPSRAHILSSAGGGISRKITVSMPSRAHIPSKQLETVLVYSMCFNALSGTYSFEFYKGLVLARYDFNALSGTYSFAGILPPCRQVPGFNALSGTYSFFIITHISIDIFCFNALSGTYSFLNGGSGGLPPIAFQCPLGHIFLPAWR